MLCSCWLFECPVTARVRVCPRFISRQDSCGGAHGRPAHPCLHGRRGPGPRRARPPTPIYSATNQSNYRATHATGEGPKGPGTAAALEGKEVSNDFLGRGIQLLVDGHEPDVVRTLLNKDLKQGLERHEWGKKIFESLGDVARTFQVAAPRDFHPPRISTNLQTEFRVVQKGT